MKIHRSVMVDEVLSLMVLSHYEVYVDMTVGSGGHASKILEYASSNAMLIGIDRDESALALTAQRLKPDFEGRFRLFLGLFSELPQVMKEAGIDAADCFLMDLGLSSYHIQSRERGFSYQLDGPLDMRMGLGKLTAYDVVNSYSPEELKQVIRELGEERNATRITKAIVDARARKPITRTTELARIIQKCVPSRFATKTLARVFQAIRMEVNNELEELRQGLENATEYLVPAGRLGVISYHSLEDRIVKNWFKDNADKLNIITHKPVTPSSEEVKDNRRARSAKLRVAERKGGDEAKE